MACSDCLFLTNTTSAAACLEGRTPESWTAPWSKGLCMPAQSRCWFPVQCGPKPGVLLAQSTALSADLPTPVFNVGAGANIQDTQQEIKTSMTKSGVRGMAWEEPRLFFTLITHWSARSVASTHYTCTKSGKNCKTHFLHSEQTSQSPA